MIRHLVFAVGCFALVGSFAPAQTPKPAEPKAAPPKAPGMVDPKLFASVCEKADVVVIGKAYAIKTGELDSEPPTPVYTNAKLEVKGLKFLKGREKLGGKPETRVVDAFGELAQAADLWMGKSVILAFKIEGKELKLMMLNATNATDAALIQEKYPDSK